jgi:thiol-disulfide isomerase/thioredoxin
MLQRRIDRNRVLLACSLAACVALAAAPAQAKLSVGDSPKFAVKTLGGRTLTHKHIRGHVTLIEFWATWCGPCIDQLPHLRKTYHKYKDDGLAMVSVSRDKRPRAARKFIKNNGMVWTQVLDKSQPRPLGDAWGVSAIPHAFLFSPAGELLWRGHPARMDEPIKEALTKFKDQLKDAKPKKKQASDGKGKGKAMARDAKTIRDQATGDDQSTAHTDDWRAIARQLNSARQELTGPATAPAKALAVLAKIDPDRLINPKLRHFAKRLADAAKALEASNAEVFKSAKRAQPAGAKRLSTLREALTAGRYQKMLPERVRQARLKQADKLRQAKQHVNAYKRYKALAKRAAATKAGQAAAERVAAYEADESFMRKVKSEDTQAEANRLLKLANSYAQAGRAELAKEKYRKILERYPDTAAAEQAKSALAKSD